MLCIQSTAVWKHPLTALPDFEEEESMQGAYDVLFDKEEYQCVTVEVRIVMRADAISSMLHNQSSS